MRKSFLSFGVLFLSALPAFGGAITSTWIDGNGLWSISGNWNNGVPNNSGGNTYSAVINNGSGVTLDATATLDNLTIAAGNSLSVNNGIGLTLNSGVGAGSIANNGNIGLNASGSVSNLSLIGGGTVTLSGSGTLTMSNNTNNRILGGNTTALVIGANQLVQGAGQIGLGQTSITNNGTITANQSAGLTIIPSSGGFTNTNLMQATSGAALTLSGVTTNTAATIQAVGSGSIVKLSGATVNGGTLGSSGGGLIENLSNSTLNGITNQGTIQTDDGAVTSLQGTITNSGLMTLNASSSFSSLSLIGGGTVTLSGSGTLTMSNNANNRILGGNTTALVIGAGQLVQGAGQIGVGQTTITNNGTITANQSAGLTISPNSGGFANNGTLNANSGTLSLLGGGVSTGSFVANAGGILNFGGATHTLNSPASLSGAGTISFSAGTTSFNGGTYNVSGITSVNGGIANFNAPASTAELDVSAGAQGGNSTLSVSTLFNWTGGTLGDTGSTNLLAGSTTSISTNATKTLAARNLNNAGAVTWSAGSFSSGTGAVFSNSGTFTTTFDGAFNYNLGGTATIFNNSGTFTKSAGVGTTSFGTAFNNSGAVQVNSGTLQLTTNSTSPGTFTMAAGGTLLFSSGTQDMSATASALTGQGTTSLTTGAVVNLGGAYNVDTTSINNNARLNFLPGASIGQRAFRTKSLSIITNARLDLGNSHAIVDYTGASPINSIRAALLSAYTPSAHWTGNGLASSAAAANAKLSLGYGEAAGIFGISGAQTALFDGQSVDATSVVVRLTLNGDATLDGKVGFSDLVAVAQHYGVIGAGTWMTGDFNYDGDIGFADLVAVAQNYGGVVAGPIPGASADFNYDLGKAFAQVPEPAGLAIFLIVGIAALRPTRSRRRQLTYRMNFPVAKADELFSCSAGNHAHCDLHSGECMC